MKIEFNEKSKVDYILKNGYVDDSKPSSSMKLLARYYNEQGMTKEQIIDAVDKFMTENYSEKYNSVTWDDVLEGIVKKAIKDNKTLTNVEDIKITKEETKYINNILNEKYQRLLFTYLVYAKILNKLNDKNNNWVSGKYRNDIFSEAKLTETGKDQLKIIFKLVNDEGALKQSVGVTNNSISVENYINDDSEVEIVINDFREIGLQWMKYKGDKKVKLCEECGIHIYQNSKKPKRYCKLCAKKKDNENRNNRKR